MRRPRRPMACTSPLCGIRPEFGLPGPIRYHRPHFRIGVAHRHVLVRENHAFADQDRAPHAFGTRGTVDQVFGLRRGAVPRRARAQSQRLPEVQPSHAHRRPRTAGAFPRRRRADGDRRRTSRPRIRSSFATASVIAIVSRRRRRPPASATRWSRSPVRSKGSRSSPARSSSNSSAAPWARWSASASSAPSITASQNKAPLVCFSSSGGARMQEALFSLLQMAKTSAALARLAQARLPFISVLTDPTTGGVSASLAMLGDLNVAEPRALIGFAGPRVIQQTVRETLPEGFQRSEFLLDHGALDMIIDRRDMRERLGALLRLLMRQPARRRPRLPSLQTRTAGMRSLAEWLEQQQRSHPSAIDLDSEPRARSRAASRSAHARLPRDHRRRHQRQGFDRRLPRCDAARRWPSLRAIHLAASHALQRAHLREWRRGRRRQSHRGVRAHRRGARATSRSRSSNTTRSRRSTLFRRSRGRRRGARGGAGRTTRRHQHHRCGRRRGLFDRHRSRRLAGRHARGDRPRKGRHFPRGASRGARQRRSAAQRVGRYRRGGRARRGARSRLSFPRRISGRRATVGFRVRGMFRCAICRRPRSRGYTRSPMRRPRWPRSPPLGGIELTHANVSQALRGRAACRDASSACRAKSSGSSMWRTTCRRRWAWPRICARCRAPARSRCAEFSATRTCRESRRR